MSADCTQQQTQQPAKLVMLFTRGYQRNNRGKGVFEVSIHTKQEFHLGNGGITKVSVQADKTFFSLAALFL